MSPYRKENEGSVSLVFDGTGRRKCLTISERNQFLAATKSMAPEVRTFCLTLAYTGARISEILALTPAQVDTAAGMIAIENLKKRRRGVYRAVPIPRSLADELELTHKMSFRAFPGMKESAGIPPAADS
jgi:integrase/recombinase XerD